MAYGLDEALIEFGNAMDQREYERACHLLEQITLTPETEAMWQNLSQVHFRCLTVTYLVQVFWSSSNPHPVTRLC